MIKLILFVVISTYILAISWKQLRKPSSHGFYRFFVFELLTALFLINVDYWLEDPFGTFQLVSWSLLIISIYPVAAGYYLLLKIGKPSNAVVSKTDFTFEKTTNLITSGIFGYIRHPMYASLLFLGWGIYFKHPDWLALFFEILITIFLYLTAIVEERENMKKFGDEYSAYMKRSKMFIPYLV